MNFRHFMPKISFLCLFFIFTAFSFPSPVFSNPSIENKTLAQHQYLPVDQSIVAQQVDPQDSGATPTTPAPIYSLLDIESVKIDLSDLPRGYLDLMETSSFSESIESLTLEKIGFSFNAPLKTTSCFAGIKAGKPYFLGAFVFYPLTPNNIETADQYITELSAKQPLPIDLGKEQFLSSGFDQVQGLTEMTLFGNKSEGFAITNQASKDKVEFGVIRYDKTLVILVTFSSQGTNQNLSLYEIALIIDNKVQRKTN